MRSWGRFDLPFGQIRRPHCRPWGSGLEALLWDAYEFLRDMSLLIATGGVAYITNVYRKRSSFVDELEQEWRDFIAPKPVLFSYTPLEKPRLEQYPWDLLQVGSVSIESEASCLKVRDDDDMRRAL
jgi:hypothetical protein